MEAIQIEANPDIQATIETDGHNSACGTPASVFPILIKLKNSHLKKIGREKDGAKKYYEKLLAELMWKIDCQKGFPKRLSLEERGNVCNRLLSSKQKNMKKGGKINE